MPKGISILALNELNDTKCRSNQNEDANCVQHVQRLLPRRFDMVGRLSRVLGYANLEDYGSEEEQAE